jgi:hypothetical protein
LGSISFQLVDFLVKTLVQRKLLQASDGLRHAESDRAEQFGAQRRAYDVRKERYYHRAPGRNDTANKQELLL